MDSATRSDFHRQILEGIPTTLPPPCHAGDRRNGLSDDDVLAVRNALRYFPRKWHDQLAKEFAEELEHLGHIYMRRFKPGYEIEAHPIGDYPARSQHAAAIMLMIQNNLHKKVAQNQDRLITYGGNGAVFQNWAQYRLTMKYLAEMTDEETLVLNSGHPLGVFPSHSGAPRLVITNGMMVPNYSTKEHLKRFSALGVTQYGQMTAGSFMYIGPQGIVHGTTITLLNALRASGGEVERTGDGSKMLRGKVFVSSGLGGMSGAQAKAAVIVGCVGVIAEVNREAIDKRIDDEYIEAGNVHSDQDIDRLFERIDTSRNAGEAVSLVYHGNVVDLWKQFVERKVRVDLGSDQTSCHNIEGLGYCPVGWSHEEARRWLDDDPDEFRRRVVASLKAHVGYINQMTDLGMHFWDYGNMFLTEAGRAGADVFAATNPGADTLIVAGSPYRYKSYVEETMGPKYFDFGFGPFRWICCSCKESDLRKTDELAIGVLEAMLKQAPDDIRTQLSDNLDWIQHAEERGLVVGSQARILYADSVGRIRISLAINDAVRSGELSAPVVIGRDHHDVSGTDSPFRETANINDGSRYTADMAVQNVIGDAFRGATWVSLHNGGGVGWGEAINGGFGLVLDGSEAADRRLQSMLAWDVNNGIARRAWARNGNARKAIKRAMYAAGVTLRVTLPDTAADELDEERDQDRVRRLIENARGSDGA